LPTDLLHLLKNTFDWKRIYANPSSYPNPNSNSKPNTNPNSNSYLTLSLKRNYVFGLTKWRHISIKCTDTIANDSPPLQPWCVGRGAKIRSWAPVTCDTRKGIKRVSRRFNFNLNLWLRPNLMILALLTVVRFGMEKTWY